MSTFNLGTIIDKHGLDDAILSKELFPKNKFPKLALSRVVSGVAFLNTWQLSKLAQVVGVPVSNLFIDDNWNKEVTDNMVKFYRNNYRAELNLETNVSEIFVSDKLVAVETLITDKNIKLSEYLKLVNEVIINLI